jgi:hypothetical protein
MRTPVSHEPIAVALTTDGARYAALRALER